MMHILNVKKTLLRALDVHLWQIRNLLFYNTHTHTCVCLFAALANALFLRNFYFKRSILWPYACLVSFMQCLTHSYRVYEQIIASYEDTQSASFVFVEMQV